MSPTLERRRSWFPRPLWFFGATIVLIVAVVALRVGLPIYRQRAALREVERLGGSYEREPGGPAWLHRVLGDEWMKYFDQVNMVRFNDGTFSDGGLAQLTGLTGLQALWFDRSDLGDAGLADLEGLTTLQQLSLAGTRIS